MGSFHISLFGAGKVTERHALEGIHWYVRLIGGYTLDLRDAEFPEQPVIINTITLIGGDKILVPRGVAVETSGAVLIGGSTVKVARGGYGHARGRLKVNVFALIGGDTVSSDRTEDEALEKGGESRRALTGDALEELDALREEVADLAERMDFTERLLARGREEPR
jgi:hypothetical protein